MCIRDSSRSLLLTTLVLIFTFKHTVEPTLQSLLLLYHINNDLQEFLICLFVPLKLNSSQGPIKNWPVPSLKNVQCLLLSDHMLVIINALLVSLTISGWIFKTKFLADKFVKSFISLPIFIWLKTEISDLQQWFPTLRWQHTTGIKGIRIKHRPFPLQGLRATKKKYNLFCIHNY